VSISVVNAVSKAVVFCSCSKGALMTRSRCKFKASSSAELLLKHLQLTQWH